jgi:hypothetical protein
VLPSWAVFPCIKLEWYAERKVFQNGVDKKALLDSEGKRIMLEDARWRLILAQATTDHIVQFRLFKEFSSYLG